MGWQLYHIIFALAVLLSGVLLVIVMGLSSVKVTSSTLSKLLILKTALKPAVMITTASGTLSKRPTTIVCYTKNATRIKKAAILVPLAQGTAL